MNFQYKPDYETVKQRYDAFWHREIIDRPLVSITFRKPGYRPFPAKEYASQEERWLDLEYRADELDYNMSQTDFLYDAVPSVMPNLGPEIFSAWCGCGYIFGPDTTWSIPAINDWEQDAHKARIDFNHPLFIALVDFTEMLIERGKGKYAVGLSDFHPGGDHLAALRDPANLAIDLIENPEWVVEMLTRSMPDYYAAYGVFYNMIKRAGMPTTSWLASPCDRTFYIPSNDFSCMISKKMFDDFFLNGLRQECQFYEHSIYHLDGPDALHHLDSLLSIPELDAIQWVCGTGNEGYHRWIQLYQKIQAAGKGIFLACDVSELPLVFETLKPEGIWFGSVSGVKDFEMADRVVKRITAWK